MKRKQLSLKELFSASAELKMEELQKAKESWLTHSIDTLTPSFGRHFIPILQLHPGQHSISYKEVGWVLRNKSSDGIQLPSLSFDDGRSILPLEKAKRALLTPYGIRLIDGHHTVIAAILSGAATFPIWIVKDYRDLFNSNQPELFLKQLVSDQFISPTDLGSKGLPPLNFFELQDDPWRTWIDESISEFSGNRIHCYTQYPIGIRHDEDIPPFCELNLARLLQSRGFEITSTYAHNLSLNETRRVLAELRSIPGIKKIPGLTLFSEPVHYSNIIETLKREAKAEDQQRLINTLDVKAFLY